MYILVRVLVFRLLHVLRLVLHLVISYSKQLRNDFKLIDQIKIDISAIGLFNMLFLSHIFMGWVYVLNSTIIWRPITQSLCRLANPLGI